MSGKKPRILFVDDDPSFLEGLRHVLYRQRKRWEMIFLQEGAAALQEAQTRPCDAIVLDLRMSGRNGFELLKDLREREETRDVPIVVLTGALDRDLKRRALDLGATDLLNKPVHAEDLLARLHSVLCLKAHQDELKELNAGLEEKVRRRTQELEAARLDVIWRLAKAGEYRDEETGNHIARVGCYCRSLAEAMNMQQEFVETVFLTGPLHDIGKLGIPDEILLKCGPLTAEEREIMERHCEIGRRILLEEPRGMGRFLEWRGGGPDRSPGAAPDVFLTTAAAIAEFHHENWDGTGYPHGLIGDESPLAARIAAVADVYDALRSDRPYKTPYSHDKTLEIMRAEAGRKFDPVVFRAFESVRDEFLRTWRQLSEASCAAGAGAPCEGSQA